LNGHLGRPCKRPPNDHYEEPSIGLASTCFGEILDGPPCKPLGRPPSGPRVGPYLGGELPYGGTLLMGTWTRHPWKPWVLTWYPTSTNLALMPTS